MLGIFRRKPSSRDDHKGVWRSFNADGVAFAPRKDDLPETALDARRLDTPATSGLLAQLEDDGRLTTVSGTGLLPWNDVYDLLDGPEQRAVRDVLALPSMCDHVPSLASAGSLRDPTFDIVVKDWRTAGGTRAAFEECVGAVVADGDMVALLPRRTWELMDQVVRFRNRPDTERSESSNRRDWGRIRRAAVATGAALDAFLHSTVVLTPEKLQIGLRKNDTGGAKVVEVVPTFDGAPDDWLNAFDTRGGVLDRYNISTPSGIVAIEIAPNVKTVLDNIKRMPGRRVAGPRAEAFLVNPFAALGEDASETIDETQFMEAREQAGLLFQRFSARIKRDALGYPTYVALVIETLTSSGPPDTEVRPFEDDEELGRFIDAVETSMAKGLQLCGWEGNDLELMGDSQWELDLLKEALKARTQPRVLVSYASIFDLSTYSSRIDDIGEEKPYYSPYIAKKDDGEGWFPENIVPVISWTPDGSKEAVAVPVTPEVREQIEAKIKDAEAKGERAFTLNGFDKPIPVAEAKSIFKTFEDVQNQVRKGTFDPTPPDRASRPKKHLVIKANIQSIDYEEARRDILSIEGEPPALPSGLKPDVKLKDHQVSGLGWMQHLFSKAPAHCRGAVLADDMGLGKTLQILSLLAWAFECDPPLPPALIIAPVSLLENWEQEARKFLTAGTLTLLTAYGDALSSLRVPRESVDEQLRAEGMVKFLKPEWRGNANVVLTTYETLRDLEFSFSAEKWSVMVCDEAQRIKNPNAMVTRAAKKQNVIFKIACTGTPVENTLTDLWCLFDYVQPGLLGALNDFGQRYRRPIEAETEEEQQRVAELRERIAPQILRRTKTEVAKDLPPKVEVPCQIPLSTHQRRLYAQAVEAFKKRSDPGAASPFKNHLGLLHYLRLVCTDPREVGLGVFQPEPIAAYRERAPKLDWLIGQLEEIRRKGEKAIIFCEFREMQRMLRYYVEVAFGFAPDIVNGDTVASAKHLDSRQKRIAAFQEKPGFGVIILSPVAVGFGVNIQAANHVIHYTRHWNPAKEDQATDRAYRIGQTKSVNVYCPMVFAEDFTTFDVKLDRLLKVKRELAEDMLNGTGDVSPGDFAIEDVAPGSAGAAISTRVTANQLSRMDWAYFECLIVALSLKQGFKPAYRTPPKDKGVDVVAIKGATGTLYQCKTSGADGGPLSWNAVKDVVAGEAAYKKRHPGIAFEKVAVTNQYFNKTASEQADLNGVRLLDQDDLADLLTRYEVTTIDVEKLLYPQWSTAA
jgi:SNF2-related domain/Restriction endonuclease/Helicase conserved C-terminal domain